MIEKLGGGEKLQRKKWSCDPFCLFYCLTMHEIMTEWRKNHILNTDAEPQNTHVIKFS